MARKPEEISDPQDLATYYLATAEFPSGFMTQYGSSMVIAERRAPGARAGLPDRQAVQVRRGRARVRRQRRPPRTPRKGRRPMARVRLRGRAAGRRRRCEDWATWMASAESPIARLHARRGRRRRGVRREGVYQQPFEEIDITRVPGLFTASHGSARADGLGEGLRGRAERMDSADIFAERELSRDGVRRRGAPRPVRGGGAAAHGDRRARGVLRRRAAVRSGCTRARRAEQLDIGGCTRRTSRAAPVRDQNDTTLPIRRGVSVAENTRDRRPRDRAAGPRARQAVHRGRVAQRRPTTSSCASSIPRRVRSSRRSRMPLPPTARPRWMPPPRRSRHGRRRPRVSAPRSCAARSTCCRSARRTSPCS